MAANRLAPRRRRTGSTALTDATLAALVDTSETVASNRRRTAKIAALAAYLRSLDAQARSLAVSYLSGELPQGKIGIGYAAIDDALRTAACAQASSLTLADLDRSFDEFASVSGAGSQLRRKAILGALFASADEREQRFLAQLGLGELRQGALASLMLDAIASASGQPLALVRRAFMFTASLSDVSEAAFSGAAELSAFQLQVFRPLQPMLAQSAQSVADALTRLQQARFELKLDGARVQVHKDGADVRVYTRALNDVTHAVPEIVETVGALPARRLVLDGETIALTAAGAPMPFQVTMKRFGRKSDVARMRETLPLTTRFFDCLLYDEQQILDEPQARRSDVLSEVLPAGLQVPSVQSADERVGAQFLSDALERGHEGVMVKSLTHTYEAGARGAGWLKLKQAHTFDLVVLAAEWGSGRRKGFLSNLHLGAYDPQHDRFVMLGKTFKGLTDKLLKWQTEALLAREVARDGHVVHVRPELVVEIAFNDVQRSPHYEGGVALRFARVKRYRDDKSAREADTFAAVLALAPAEATP